MMDSRNLLDRLSAWRSQCLCLVVVIASMFGFTGCVQRQLCYDHTHPAYVRIEFDWSEAPDASPNTMVVYFFPVDNSQYTRIELPADGSGSRVGFNSTVKVPAETYYVVCHNGETENNFERGETFSNYYLTTIEEDLLAPLNRSEYAPRPAATEEEPVRTQASRLYTHTLPDPVTLEPACNKLIVMKPRRKSVVINVTVENVKNMTDGMEFSGIVSGLSESWFPATGMPGGREVTVPLSLYPDDTGSLHGSMEVFGDNAPHEVGHKFRLYTSAKYYYDFDVTDQIHSAPDPYNVDILLTGVTLPGIDGGMDVSVQEWDSAEHIDLSM